MGFGHAVETDTGDRWGCVSGSGIAGGRLGQGDFHPGGFSSRSNWKGSIFFSQHVRSSSWLWLWRPAWDWRFSWGSVVPGCGPRQVYWWPFFVFLNGRNYYLVSKGLRSPEDCGCFGELFDRTPAEAFWQDLFLLLPALALVLWGRMREVRPLSKVRLVLALFAAIGIPLFAWSNPDLHFADVATQIAQGSEGGGFLRSQDYLLMVNGTEVPEGEIYHSQDPVAFLILAPQLSFPLLLQPQERRVEPLQTEEVIRRDDGSIQLALQSDSRVSVSFEVLPEGIAFTVDGREVLMKNKQR